MQTSTEFTKEFTITFNLIHAQHILGKVERGDTADLTAGTRLTYSTIARATGLNRKTVKHWHSLEKKHKITFAVIVLADYYKVKLGAACYQIDSDGKLISQ